MPVPPASTPIAPNPGASSRRPQPVQIEEVSDEDMPDALASRQMSPGGQTISAEKDNRRGKFPLGLRIGPNCRCSTDWGKYKGHTCTAFYSRNPCSLQRCHRLS